MPSNRLSAEERSCLSDRIRSARREAKLSQTDIARIVGVTASAVAQWEHRRGTVASTRLLQDVAKATRVSFYWLVTGEGPRRKRRSAQLDEITAIRLDIYAQDAEEESLLQTFRMLRPAVRAAFCDLLKSLSRA